MSAQNLHLVDHVSAPAPKASTSLPVQPQGPTSPVRPKHLTTRSITEISPPSHSKKSHHHHHHPHIHKHKHSDSQVGLGEELSRSEGVTPEESRNVSRRGSIFGSSEMEVPGSLNGKRPVKEGEVREEKERGQLRATELRNALLELNALSNNTTRRLDNTYYSVLEKLSILQSTITSMKELASMTRRLNEEFSTEAEGVVADVKMQLDGFDGFEDQEKRITSLAERVQKGRKRIGVLAGRVEGVRSRVDGWEEAEKEWKDKTRKRLKIMWIVMAVIGGIFLAGLVFQYSPAKPNIPDTSKALNASGLLGRMPDMEAINNGTREVSRAIGQTLEGLRDNERREDDPRLRIFDEL